MNAPRLVIGLLVALGCCGAVAQQSSTGSVAAGAKPPFDFGGVRYFHRWSKNHQHEFTPTKQEDLKAWTDMVTINVYPNVRDGDALAQRANEVLENYKGAKAMVLKTSSVPRTRERPAEHFIAVAFPQPAFIEVAFARFKLENGTGCSVVYSHRIYGEKAGNEVSAWLKANGPKLKKTLLEWNAIPSPAALVREVL